MSCESTDCKRSESKQCRTCGHSLCTEHWRLSKGCGVSCKVPKPEALTSPGVYRISDWAQDEVKHSISLSIPESWEGSVAALLKWTWYGLLLAVGAFVWWALLPTFVGTVNALGSDDGPVLIFPINMIVYCFIFGFFMIPLVILWGICQQIYERISESTLTPSSVPSNRSTSYVSRPQGSVPPKSWAQLPDMSLLSYDDYLASEAWRNRRQIMLERFSHKCQLCGGSDRLQVHHRTYDRIGNERPEDLTVLCGACHTVFHQHRGMPESGKTW